MACQVDWLFSLKVLDLNDNKISQIGTSICSLVALEKLGLKGNQLVRVPREIFRLSNLKEMSLDWFVLRKTQQSKQLDTREEIRHFFAFLKCDFFLPPAASASPPTSPDFVRFEHFIAFTYSLQVLPNS